MQAEIKSTKPRSDKTEGQPNSAYAVDGEQEDFKAARLEFLRMMLRELRELAVGANEPTLVYLVEMAAMEAAEAAQVHKYKTELHPGSETRIA